MRDPKRIDKILGYLREFWMHFPDMRFGQVIENLYGCEKQTGRCIFYVEDDETEKGLKKAVEKFAK